MAEEFIEEIYSISQIPSGLRECIEACNCEDAWQFSAVWNSYTENISKLMARMIGDGYIQCEQIKKAIVEIQKNEKNLLVIADIIESRILPIVNEFLDSMDKIDVEEAGWTLTSSRTGFLNLCRSESGRYFYNMYDPYRQCMERAQYLYKSNIRDIVIMGCGMGYLAHQLWKCSFGSANIHILEKDSIVADFAINYGTLSWIDESKITIEIGDTWEELFERFTSYNVDYSNSLFIIEDWVVDDLGAELRSRAKDFIENQKMAARYYERNRINYNNNINKFAGTIADIRASIDVTNSRKSIVVAAGPSLNNYIGYLAENKGKSTIIAVGAAFKKLLAAGIEPDYITVFDPNESMMNYISGLDEQTGNIPLIADASTYWGYLDKYKGPIYRVITTELTYTIEKEGKIEESINLGHFGTITGLAIEEAVYLGADTVELIGLDLAYPGGKHHADGVGVDTSKARFGDLYVRSVTGEQVSTSAAFNLFRREIESQIQRHSDVKFINLSTNGAYIAGTYCGQWYEEIPDTREGRIDYLSRLSNESFHDSEEKYYLIRQLTEQFPKDYEDNTYREVLANTYDGIKDRYLSKIMIDKDVSGNNTSNEKNIYLICSGLDEKDVAAIEVLNDAMKLEERHGYKVLIINSQERFGGKKIALKGAKEYKKVDEVRDREAIFYMGKKFAYFQCNADMPDSEYINEIVKYIQANRPYSIICYDSLSILAAAIDRIIPVEYKYGKL